MTHDNIKYVDILPYLQTSYLGKSYLYYDEIDSTLKEAKRLLQNNNNFKNGTIIISELQTAGIGKFNRPWHSPAKCGLWFSIILDLSLCKIDTSKITLLVGAAVCSSLQKKNINAKIKWPNDIYLNNKKIGGILCQRIIKKTSDNFLVIGIGLNINTPLNLFPDNLKDSASSLFIEEGIIYSRAKILGDILNTLEYFIERQKKLNNYTEIIKLNKKFSNTINKQVTVFTADYTYNAFVNDLSDNGELIITNNQGRIERLMSGDISIRVK